MSHNQKESLQKSYPWYNHDYKTQSCWDTKGPDSMSLVLYCNSYTQYSNDVTYSSETGTNLSHGYQRHPEW